MISDIAGGYANADSAANANAGGKWMLLTLCSSVILLSMYIL